MAGANAITNGEIIGMTMAAYGLAGNSIFQMSHKTSVLVLNQAIAFLLGKEIYSSIRKDGIVRASTHDYVYRDNSDAEINQMNFWEFVATHEICNLPKAAKPMEDGKLVF